MTETARVFRNKFNKLSSKEWLPFQKSWFRYNGKEKLYRDNIRFFTLDNSLGEIFYSGEHLEIFNSIAADEGFQICGEENRGYQIQFAVIDLVEKVSSLKSYEDYFRLKNKVISIVKNIHRQLVNGRFLSVFILNISINDRYFPFAWDLAKNISNLFSLKDEKIACIDIEQKKNFYCLYFKKDDDVKNYVREKNCDYFSSTQQLTSNQIPSWFILKPQPRKKNEMLHPAKFPEELATMFIKQFTKEGANVFDPMCGTGSTQLAALKLNRNGYGTELSEFFSEIAIKRCNDFLEWQDVKPKFKIINKDARTIDEKNFPPMDYIITSPPYWDMLNMKGAENQAKRIKKGLQTNYSSSDKDLSNISDYNLFFQELCSIYRSLIKLMKPGSHITIIAKNIKKKGKNYPFAWDIACELQKDLILLPEAFWCQDDISIAPYGYGNTWVSNTFHQYCLTFQKPF